MNIEHSLHSLFKSECANMQTLKALVEFIAKNDTKINSLEDALSLYKAAKKYDLCELEDRCLRFVSEAINVNTVCEVLEFARDNSKPDIIELCENVICWETEEVLNAVGFTKAHPNTVYWIFQLDDLIIRSELVLFIGMERWFNAHFPYAESLVDLDTETRSMVKKLIRSIRYLALQPSEFIKNVYHSMLLTSEEKLSLLSLIVSPNSNVLLPPEFSAKRDRHMRNQLKFVEEFNRLLVADVASPDPVICSDCEKYYSNYYIDHLFFYCTNTSTVDREKLMKFMSKYLKGNIYEIHKELFEQDIGYNKAVCRYVRMNFNWIQLNETTFLFDL